MTTLVRGVLPADVAAGIRRARLDAGMTAAQVAALVGVSEGQVRRFEDGTRRPSPGVAAALRLALHLPDEIGERLTILAGRH